MSTEKEFDYQAYMRNLPRSDENASNPVKINRGPEERQKRWEAAKARNSQKDITTVAQFHARLAELDAEKKPFLYRGQSESDWPVNCSAARRLTGFATNPIENQLIDQLLIGYLEYLIGKARRRGFIPSDLGASTADLELMAHLQHQGAATGLIDFTRQPLAALWFACNESRDKDGAVYVLPHSETTEIKRRDVLKKKIQFFYEENGLWSWEPPAFGSRIVAQSSVFVFGIPAIPSPKMKKLTISAASKNSILGELETAYGINEEALFPDFSGYAVANSSKKAFEISRTIDYWKEHVDSVDGIEKARAYLSCGVAFSAIQEYEEAIGHYDKAICNDRQYAIAYNNRGIIKDELGQYDEAMADYDEAIRIDPQYATAYNNRGATKGKLGRHEEAMADYDKAIRITPQFAEAYNNRGVVKVKLSWYEEAIADFDAAICLDPQYADYYYNRGNAKGELGRHEEAIADYDEALRIDPQYVKARFNREIAKGKLHRPSPAK